MCLLFFVREDVLLCLVFFLRIFSHWIKNNQISVQVQCVYLSIQLYGSRLQLCISLAPCVYMSVELHGVRNVVEYDSWMHRRRGNRLFLQPSLHSLGHVTQQRRGKANIRRKKLLRRIPCDKKKRRRRRRKGLSLSRSSLSDSHGSIYLSFFHPRMHISLLISLAISVKNVFIHPCLYFFCLQVFSFIFWVSSYSELNGPQNTVRKKRDRETERQMERGKPPYHTCVWTTVSLLSFFSCSCCSSSSS